MMKTLPHLPICLRHWDGNQAAAYDEEGKAFNADRYEKDGGVARACWAREDIEDLVLEIPCTWITKGGAIKKPTVAKPKPAAAKSKPAAAKAEPAAKKKPSAAPPAKKRRTDSAPEGEEPSGQASEPGAPEREEPEEEDEKEPKEEEEKEEEEERT